MRTRFLISNLIILTNSNLITNKPKQKHRLINILASPMSMTSIFPFFRSKPTNHISKPSFNKHDSFLIKLTFLPKSFSIPSILVSTINNLKLIKPLDNLTNILKKLIHLILTFQNLGNSITRFIKCSKILQLINRIIKENLKKLIVRYSILFTIFYFFYKILDFKLIKFFFISFRFFYLFLIKIQI